MKTDKALEKAVNYLIAEQLESGGFTSASSPQRVPFRATKQYETTFFPSLILKALDVVKIEAAKSVRSRIATFLRNEMSDDGSLNYWVRSSAAAREFPYPDDLDDTFCALGALRLHSRSAFDGSLMAQVAHMLIDRETSPGGPYRTWLVGDSKKVEWQTVDVVVNANIAACLALDDITLAPVTSMIETAVAKGEITTPFYPDSGASAYLLSRTKLSVRAQKQLQNSILNGCSEGAVWATPHQTALAVVALLNLNYPADLLAAAVSQLRVTQQPDGSWPIDCFSIDPALDGTSYYAGSAALTTAVCCEALALYDRQSCRKAQVILPTRSKKQVAKRPERAVRASIMSISRPELRESAITLLDAMIASGGDGKITALPELMAKGLPTMTDDEVLQRLATASLWGWMSYTAFDDVIDGDSAATILPAALFCNRQLLECLGSALPALPAFHEEIAAILTRIDAANAWELTHCRGNLKDGYFIIQTLPDYQNHWQLADRSLGHAIAALGVLYSHGIDSDAPDMQAARDFFEHYLIARQLLDEAHDWHTDLLKGHVNAVAAMLLDRLYGSASWTGKLAIKKVIPTLQAMLWTDVIADVCATIGFHLQAAREVCSAPGLSVGYDGLLKMLTPLEAATKRTLDERNDSLAFLQTF